MTLWLIAALALYFLQLFTPSLIRIPQIGVARYVGSRDDLPDLPIIGQRSERAFRNLQESFPVFLALMVLYLAGVISSTDSVMWAQIFVIARLVYFGFYLLAVPWGRSLVWSVGFLALLGLAKPLLSLI